MLKHSTNSHHILLLGVQPEFHCFCQGQSDLQDFPPSPQMAPSLEAALCHLWLLTSCWLGIQGLQQETLLFVMVWPWLYGARLGKAFQHFLLKGVHEVSLLVVTNTPSVPISVFIGLHRLGLPEASTHFYLVFVSSPQKQHLNKQYTWWRGNHYSYSMLNPKEFDLAPFCVLGVSLVTWVHYVLLFFSFFPPRISICCTVFTNKTIL